MLNRNQALIILVVQMIILAIGVAIIGLPNPYATLAFGFAASCVPLYWAMGGRWRAFTRAPRSKRNVKNTENQESFTPTTG